eukprot:4669692-Prymnesium_polylepis.1
MARAATVTTARAESRWRPPRRRQRRHEAPGAARRVRRPNRVARGWRNRVTAAARCVARCARAAAGSRCQVLWPPTRRCRCRRCRRSSARWTA